ncbi:MAG TPA: hypothetical protein VK139_01655 [Microbacteriaceae bacterium]|nr:hypothetical protein [Microbacteriaceae bacterium]
MRLVLSITAFCLAFVFLGAGVVQRTIFLQPGSITQAISGATDALYTVISPEVLGKNPGIPTVTARGSGATVVAYGRTDDVLAWIGAAPYNAVTLRDGAVTSETVTPEQPAESVNPQPLTGSPAGSDLWLAEGVGEGLASVTSALPPGYSAIVAGDGQSPAPGDVIVAWPIDNATPWVGPLLVLGALLFIAGGALFWLHWKDHHRAGPRRRGPSALEESAPPRPRVGPAPKRRELGPARGRRTRFRVVAALTLPVVLSGCSAEYWPGAPAAESSATPSPTISSADGLNTLQPAVTVPQMERILGEIAAFAVSADKALTADRLPERFAGPALAARAANYAIRAKKADYPAPTDIPAKPLTITLPQQTDRAWPRLVMTVTQNEADSSLPPVALVMLQNSPRDNYHVYYAITLVPNAQSPELAPANVGAPRVAPDSKLTKIEPAQLAGAYSSILNADTASEFADVFQVDGDTLRQQLGVAGQAAIRSQLPANSAIAFGANPGNGPVLALATNDAGAIVAVQVDQLRRITPTDGGVVGFAEGSPSALLSGFAAKSPRGVQSVSGLQLLVYVPAVDSQEPIRILGWTESLIAAGEIPG